MRSRRENGSKWCQDCPAAAPTSTHTSSTTTTHSQCGNTLQKQPPPHTRTLPVPMHKPATHLPHAATHCGNTLQKPATHFHTLTSHCDTLPLPQQHTSAHCHILNLTLPHYHILLHTATQAMPHSVYILNSLHTFLCALDEVQRSFQSVPSMKSVQSMCCTEVYSTAQHCS